MVEDRVGRSTDEPLPKNYGSLGRVVRRTRKDGTVVKGMIVTENLSQLIRHDVPGSSKTEPRFPGQVLQTAIARPHLTRRYTLVEARQIIAMMFTVVRQLIPCRIALFPRAQARYVFPAPVGPTMMTF